MNAVEKLKQVNQNIWFVLIFIFASMFYLIPATLFFTSARNSRIKWIVLAIILVSWD